MSISSQIMNKTFFIHIQNLKLVLFTNNRTTREHALTTQFSCNQGDMSPHCLRLFLFN